MNQTHNRDHSDKLCSPANLTVRKIRDEVSSPPSVQAPVDADRYQGVVTQWYSPLSLDEDTVCVDNCAPWSFPSIVTCDHSPRTLTCREFRGCSTSTCWCPCVRWKRHWMSSEFLSLQRRSGRCSPPGWSSLRRVAA